jgi:hypothetical protein
MERVLDVGTKNEKGNSLKLLNDDEGGEQQDHAHAAFAQTLTKSHALTANPREEVIGQRHRFFGRGIESLLFLVKNR